MTKGGAPYQKLKRGEKIKGTERNEERREKTVDKRTEKSLFVPKEVERTLELGEEVLRVAEKMAGWGKYRGTLIITNRRVIFYNKKLIGSDSASIPFEQTSEVSLTQGKLHSVFKIRTVGGERLKIDYLDQRKGEPKRVFDTIKKIIEDIAAVPIAVGHNKSLMNEIWSFSTPARLAVVEVPAAGSVKFCPHCSAKVKQSGAKFCSGCGGKLK